MSVEYQFITKEISQKGEAYLLLQRIAPEAVAGLLRCIFQEAAAQGAVRLLAASVDPALPLAEGVYDGLRLEYIHDMHLLERTLKGCILPMGELMLAPLETGRVQEWLELYNEGFFYVPNSATYKKEDLDAALAEGRQCGFVLAEGTAAGVYELNPVALPPEISGIALLPAFQGRGLGRQLLRAVMAELVKQGFQNCRLTVSTANQRAYGLYLSEGFQFAKTKSRWFQVRCADAP